MKTDTGALAFVSWFKAQPETRGQEADETWAALAHDLTHPRPRGREVSFQRIFDKHRPLIEAALRGQVREGIDVERLARAIEVPETVYPGSVDVDGMKVARRIAAEYDRLQGLSGGEG